MGNTNLEAMVNGLTDDLMKKMAIEWVDNSVTIDKLDDNVSGTVDDLRSRGEDEDGVYQAWAGTIVGGSYGQYIPVAFAHEVLWADDDYEELQEQWSEAQAKGNYDLSEQFYMQGCGIVDKLGDFIAEELNSRSKLSGNYWVGYHEADGSLGILYGEHEE